MRTADNEPTTVRDAFRRARAPGEVSLAVSPRRCSLRRRRQRRPRHPPAPARARRDRWPGYQASFTPPRYGRRHPAGRGDSPLRDRVGRLQAPRASPFDAAAARPRRAWPSAADGRVKRVSRLNSRSSTPARAPRRSGAGVQAAGGQNSTVAVPRPVLITSVLPPGGPALRTSTPCAAWPCALAKLDGARRGVIVAAWCWACCGRRRTEADSPSQPALAADRRAGRRCASWSRVACPAAQPSSSISADRNR